MRIGILGNERSWYVEALTAAAARRAHTAFRLDFRALVSSVTSTETVISCGDITLNGLDAVIVRTMPPGSLEQVIYRMDVLARLEHAGVRVVNSPKAVECAVDKFLTTSRLADAGLPVPATVTCESSDAAMDAFDSLGGDVVVKPLFGSEGRGIVRVTDREIAFRTFRTLERIDATLYIQRFIDHGGVDTRILILDGKVIGECAAFRKTTSAQTWRKPARRSLTIQPRTKSSLHCRPRN